MLSVHYSDQLIRDILDAGVRGYIVKSDSDRDLIVAVEALSNHKPFFTPRATELILTNFNSPAGAGADISGGIGDRLTSREREIVQLLSEGKSSKEVASVLSISVKTAETPHKHDAEAGDPFGERACALRRAESDHRAVTADVGGQRIGTAIPRALVSNLAYFAEAPGLRII